MCVYIPHVQFQIVYDRQTDRDGNRTPRGKSKLGDFVLLML